MSPKAWLYCRAAVVIVAALAFPFIAAAFNPVADSYGELLVGASILVAVIVIGLMTSELRRH